MVRGMLRVHGDIAAVGTDVQGGRVVVVGLQVGMQHRSLDTTCHEVVRDDLDVALPGLAAGPVGAGHRADEQLSSSDVNDGTLVLEP